MRCKRQKKKPNIFLLLHILFVLCLSCPKDFFLSSESQQANNLKMINIDFTVYSTVLLEFCLQQKVIFVVLKRGLLIQGKGQCAESTEADASRCTLCRACLAAAAQTLGVSQMQNALNTLPGDLLQREGC